MAKHFAIVAGNGETSRANVEALLEDYIYLHKKDEVVFIIAYNRKASQGQIFAAQLAQDKGFEVLAVCKEEASLEGLPKASVFHSETPYELAADWENAVVFVLPNEEDQENTTNILKTFSAAKIPMFDLTEGLYPIKPLVGDELEALDEGEGDELTVPEPTSDDLACQVREILNGHIPEANLQAIDALIRTAKAPTA